MQIEEAEFGGTNVILIHGDRLEDVPESHQHLVSDELRRAFVDPTASLDGVIERCRFEQMKRWLIELRRENNWRLEMHQSAYDESGEAGFWWSSSTVRGARIHPAVDGEFPSHYPEDFRIYYDLVDTVDWNGFGAGGRFFGYNNQESISSWGIEPPGPKNLDPDETYAWGNSPSGDSLIWSMDGCGGWFSLETHKIHLLGSIADTIDWVYNELIHHRCPEWDYCHW